MIGVESRFGGSDRRAGANRPGRRLSASIALSIAGLFSLALGISSASAADIGHEYLSSFGGSGTNALGTPTGADVDNSGGPSAGDVYVTDSQNHRVEKFDATGNFILMFGDGVNQTTNGDICTAASGNLCRPGAEGSGPQQFVNPSFVAVDDSSGPSAGDVYIGDQGNGSMFVRKFTEAGALVTGWGVGGVLDGSSGGNGAFTLLGGIDVDSSGNLITWDTNQGRIAKFSQSGAYISSFGGGEGVCRGHDGTAMAVAPNGTQFYKVNGDDTVQRMTEGNPSACVTISLDSSTRGLNVDNLTGTLYQSREGEVDEYKFDNTGQPLDSSNGPCPIVLNENSGCEASHKFGAGNITSGRGVGVNWASGNVYVADFGNHEIDVFKPAIAPRVTTGDPVANTTVSGEAAPDGAGNVVECFFEYGTTIAYGSKQDCTPAPEFSSPQAVTAVLPELLGETEYHYRLVAKGAAGGTNFGLDKVIVPHNVKGLKTEAATAVTRTSAELHASFEGNGEPTTYFFEWGTSTEPYSQKSSSQSAGSPSFPPVTPLAFTPSGLLPDTTYHFRAVAQNGIGVSPSKDMTFQTLPAVQSLLTEAASDVAPRSVTLNGSYVGDGTPTSYFFEWGKTTDYNFTTPVVNVGSPSGATTLPASLAGLELETGYHFRIVATNGLGTTKGLDQTFTTHPAVAGLLTLPATAITDENVTLNAEFNGNGDATHYVFEWGLTTAYGKKAPVSGEDAGEPTGVTPLSVNLTDFEGYSTYHYRIVASNSLGETKGNDLTFTTLPAELPGISGTIVSSVDPTSATVGAQVDPNRWMTAYQFEYGTTTNYGAATQVGDLISGTGNSAQPVSASLGGLIPATIYHFRVVATNFQGTTHGPDQTFTTPGVPGIESVSSSAIGQTTAHLSAAVAGNASPTSVRFEYGLDAAYGSNTAAAPIGSSLVAQPTGVDLTNLMPGTTYHFRVVASNGIGASNSPDATFTTAPAPVPLEAETKPVKCRKGFVKKHGKCVKKKKPHKKKNTKGQRNG